MAAKNRAAMRRSSGESGSANSRKTTAAMESTMPIPTVASSKSRTVGIVTQPSTRPAIARIYASVSNHGRSARP